ncbi:hypothetical protein M378DRAFT_17761 [Amanita muscaria Koide BX008]|uniref:Ribonuclease H1 N-terminal domain-containing protein n=1 Tax=Amanita muscaria (strain Koide BX008) TaxID=946122 RepID=A0A0C2W3H5_AMAMK|nr:hypothetical protein M378DRAFT_17761 [Amanita muscaria Koide BX008]
MASPPSSSVDSAPIVNFNLAQSQATHFSVYTKALTRVGPSSDTAATEPAQPAAAPERRNESRRAESEDEYWSNVEDTIDFASDSISVLMDRLSVSDTVAQCATGTPNTCHSATSTGISPNTRHRATSNAVVAESIQPTTGGLISPNTRHRSTSNTVVTVAEPIASTSRPDGQSSVQGCRREKRKYYCVTQGRNVGVFTDWNYVKSIVTKIDAHYKGYNSRQAAEAAYNRAEREGRLNILRDNDLE